MDGRRGALGGTREVGREEKGMKKRPDLLAAGDAVGWAVVLCLCLGGRGRRGEGEMGVCDWVEAWLR